MGLCRSRKAVECVESLADACCPAPAFLCCCSGARPPLAAASRRRRLPASSALTCVKSHSPFPEQGYREDDGLYLESDTDEQLLIHIPFNTACKLQGLVIKSSKAPEQVLLDEEVRRR